MESPQWRPENYYRRGGGVFRAKSEKEPSDAARTIGIGQYLKKKGKRQSYTFEFKLKTVGKLRYEDL